MSVGGVKKKNLIVCWEQVISPLQVFFRSCWYFLSNEFCGCARVFVDKVPEPSHKHSLKLHCL